MRVDRLLSLLALLQNRRRITAAEAAAQLGVSVRTLQRDVDVLSAAGVPVYTQRGRGGGIRIHERYAARLTALSAGESAALGLVSTPSVLGELGVERDHASALEKIAAAVPAVHQLRARQARQRLMVDTVPWFHHASAAVEHLDVLRHAIWSDAVCRIDYQRGDGARRQYRVDAYALVAKVDVWYLVGRTRDGMRVFRLSRIRDLTVTDACFARRANFDLGPFWKRWCRRFETRPIARYWVTLSLSAAGRRMLLDRYGGWHAGVLSGWEAGVERDEVALDLENEDVAARVVFELGGEAQVLAPATLKESIRRRIEALMAAADGP